MNCARPALRTRKQLFQDFFWSKLRCITFWLFYKVFLLNSCICMTLQTLAFKTFFFLFAFFLFLLVSASTSLLTSETLSNKRNRTLAIKGHQQQKERRPRDNRYQPHKRWNNLLTFKANPRQNTKKAAAFGINGKKNYISDFSGAAFYLFKIVTWVPIWEGIT